VTTQNNEPENNDTNETVVQQPTASETPITSAEAEVTMPANEQDTQTHEIQSKTSEKQIEEEPVRSFTDYIEEFRQNEVQFVLPIGETGNGTEEPAELQVQPAAEVEAVLPAVRQTSPLLRPSSRVRLPRQAGMRHREESVVEGQTQQEQKSETTIVTMPSVEDTSKADETPVEEKPRPERRYR